MKVKAGQWKAIPKEIRLMILRMAADLNGGTQKRGRG